MPMYRKSKTNTKTKTKAKAKRNTRRGKRGKKTMRLRPRSTRSSTRSSKRGSKRSTRSRRSKRKRSHKIKDGGARDELCGSDAQRLAIVREKGVLDIPAGTVFRMLIGYRNEGEVNNGRPICLADLNRMSHDDIRGIYKSWRQKESDTRKAARRAKRSRMDVGALPVNISGEGADLDLELDLDMDADADHIVSSMRTMPKEFVVASPDRVLHASRAAVEWESPATKSNATKSNATKSNANMGDDAAEDRSNKRRRNELFPVADPMGMMDDVGELGDSSDADMFSLGLFDGKGIDGKVFDGK